jgi:hypothetical protein
VGLASISSQYVKLETKLGGNVMGASVYVQARDASEWAVLESEGAPEFHATYSTLMVVFETIGRSDLDPVGGSIEPTNLPAIYEACTKFAEAAPDGREWAVRQFGMVARAAYNLRRSMSWG